MMSYAEFLLRGRAGAMKQISLINALRAANNVSDTDSISRLASLENLANGR
jgi:hypothetical protein